MAKKEKEDLYCCNCNEDDEWQPIENQGLTFCKW
jgi:hypothetical protein